MSIVAEEWRAVVGDEGKTEVSNLGNVRFVDGRPRKGTRMAIGYVCLNIRGRVRYVHHLVLESFVGPRPSKNEACHCNGVRTDNRLANLRWDTTKANQMDRVKHGTSNRGERCATAILTADQAIEIYHSPQSTSDLARKYGVAPQTISGIRRGDKWKHATQPQS